jgi:hypothetical protein
MCWRSTAAHRHEEIDMVASPLLVLLLFSAWPVATSQPDTIQPPDSAQTGATFAPTDSSTSWYRHTAIDTRLIQPTVRDWNTDTVPRRRHAAVEYSDWYYRRLQIHRWGSFAELPVFAAEYWLGNKLISRSSIPGSWVKPTHVTVATALGGLFAVNTVTGVWNLYDSRKDTDQRALVWSHSALMLAADAGFAVTGLLGGDAGGTTANANRHRNAGLISMGFATAGTVLMWAVRGF